ncbi:MAG: carbohydrate kinase [Phycisphaeraceae bacterium]|nr:carbohydrate kinase [Phycisphaeraceae bacterium]
MASSPTIVGLGEALFDVFPDREVLGGAPLNVAVQAHQLGAQGVVVSRVGQDQRGDQLVAELTRRGMTDTYIQRDPDRATGVVYITPEPDGGHQFEIAANAAWDWIQFDPDLEHLATRADAVAFGTLGQRQSESRGTIGRFVSMARRAIRLFDINLRQDFYDARLIRRCAELATIIKLNRDELATLADLIGLSGDDEQALCRDAIRKLEVRMLALTRGPEGTVLFDDKGRCDEAEVESFPPASDADAVGAGDACSAGLLIGLLRRWPGQRIVRLANRMGGYVASQPGACPELPKDLVEKWLSE